MATTDDPRPTITILGSLNIDFITLTPRLPSPGETLSATSFTTGYGGKGANQAVACARLSPPDYHIRMLGKVGDDTFGGEYLDALRKEGLDVEGVRVVQGGKTGVTNIIVEEGTGENRILFVANANQEFEPEESLVNTQDGAGKREVVVLQLEIPLETVLHNLSLASSAGSHSIFNPAPAIPLPDSAYPHISTLIMNETEASIISSSSSSSSPTTSSSDPTNKEEEKKEPSIPSLLTLAKSFLARGVKEIVIITLGGKGLVYASRSGGEGHVAAESVKVVDTTAAGDTFVGGYAVQRAKALAEGEKEWDVARALGFATKAAARTVERAGAMSAIPYLKEVKL
ncbi:ribokinase like protein [Zymoseptoria brevis]|uniref:Ribokinase n=1 Tax=Zymoseptoria brevis TaxID=1047168 RepID=A0A0F4GM35_9PEZI|nr:ribokinase like protein [Zymoseptoria brevis]